MIEVRKLADGGYEVNDGYVRLLATLNAFGSAEVVDTKSGEILKVHEVGGRILALTADAQRVVEQAADDVIAQLKV